MSVEEPLTGDALINAVRIQVEYYFSKENLQTDAFLNSLMDAHNSAPLSAVMKFAKLKALTQDEAVVVEALLASSLVTLIDGRIKSNAKLGRYTIILRDIPSDAPEDEILAIFNYDSCKSITSIRSELGDNWFITMESEEDAKDTLLDLRIKKRTFRGEAVKGRLKSESVVKSFYPIQPVPVIPSVQMGAPFNGFVPPMVPMFGYPVPVLAPMEMMPIMATQELKDGTENSSISHDGTQNVVDEVVKDLINSSINGKKLAATISPKGGVSANQSKPKVVVAGTTHSGGIHKTTTAPLSAPTGAAMKKPVSSSPSKVSTGKDEKKAAIDTSSRNFPPLVAVDDSIAPTPGFKTEFKKYAFEEIISIVGVIKEACLPASIIPLEHSVAMEAVANPDLLLRQRTFSIDETREQLRQGRPVQREAVVSGAVDFQAFVYGEGVSSAVDTEVVSIIGEQVSAEPPIQEKKPPASSWAALVMSAAAKPGAAIQPKKNAVVAANRNVRKKNDKSTAVEPVTSSINDAIKEKVTNEEKVKLNGGIIDIAGSSTLSEDKQKDKRHAEGRDRRVANKIKKEDIPPPALPTSSWGGKPTFANVLKQQEAKDSELSTRVSTETKEELGETIKTARASSAVTKPKDGMSGSTWTKESIATLPKNRSRENRSSEHKEKKKALDT